MAKSATLESLAPSPLMGRRHFFALNTGIQVLTLDWQQTELMQGAEQVFRSIEERFSRFLQSSELCRLNARTGEEVAVSPQMFQVLQLSLEFHRRSGGTFDPAILPNLRAAGYDRSFELILRESEEPVTAREPVNASIADVRLDRERLTAQAPAGVLLDLGGIGKGFAVDEAANALSPARDFLIDAGGDIYASGNGPGGSGWTVSVAHPFGGDEIALVDLRDQALATSTTVRRSWRRGARRLHHLIDPRTGEPAETDVVSVSVLASSAVTADVFAKVALIRGFDAGREFIQNQGAAGLFVFPDGSWQAIGDFPGGEWR